MSTYFINTGGSTIRLSDRKPVLNIYDKLPPHTYAVKLDMEGYYLERISDFELPEKLYGKTTRHRDRIIGTFHDRPNATGVFLEGEKGSGKTLLAKAISLKMLKQGHPTLVVNQPMCGEGFNTFIQSINQPKVVLFDEFEKIYDDESQPRVLTLFDGVYPTKALFVVTCNDSWKIDKHMKNRPGRLFYMLTFGGLERDFIKEYALDNLKNKTHIDGLLNATALFEKLNFDMLKAIIEEMNRYGEEAKEVIEILNTKPGSTSSTYNVELIINDVVMPKQHDYISFTQTFHGDPTEDDINIVFYDRTPPEELSPADKDDKTKVAAYIRASRANNQRQFMFNAEHLTAMNGELGTYTFKDGDATVVLTQIRKKKINYGIYMA